MIMVLYCPARLLHPLEARPEVTNPSTVARPIPVDAPVIAATSNGSRHWMPLSPALPDLVALKPPTTTEKEAGSTSLPTTYAY